MLQEDLFQISKNCTPLNLNLEHLEYGAAEVIRKGGLAGSVRRVWVDHENPGVLRGEIVIPKAIDDLLDGNGLYVEIDRQRKSLVVAALTYSPRVSEASLMSVFSRMGVSFDDNDPDRDGDVWRMIGGHRIRRNGAPCITGKEFGDPNEYGNLMREANKWGKDNQKGLHFTNKDSGYDIDNTGASVDHINCARSSAS